MTKRARFTIVSPLAVLAVVVAAAGPGAGVSSAQSQQCEPRDDYQVNITVGDITCDDAYEIADEYDLDGEKYQDIGAFQCYTGTAQSRPLIFQCVSDRAEFAVSEA